MIFEITTHTLDAVWEHRPWHQFSGSLGSQIITQLNTTDRGGLIPNFNSQSAGFFWIERWRKYHFPLELEAGIRYDLRWMDIERRGNDLINQQLDFSNLSGSFGAVFRPTEYLDVRFHAGNAWRSPTVSELYSDGVHHGSASYEKGRTDLQPERAFSLDLTIGFDNHRNLSASISLYRNVVRDFIYLKPLPQPVLTIRGAFPSFSYEQTNARLMGFDWNAKWKPWNKLAISSSASILRAWNQSEQDWLVLMPADRLRHGVKLFFKAKKQEEDTPFVGLSMQNVFRQSKVPEGQDYAPPPSGYTLLDLEAGATLPFGKNKLQINLSAQNLLNTRYRDYLNRLRFYGDEMGLNVPARLKLMF
jgi:iron complex outermembrane receptor protein